MPRFTFFFSRAHRIKPVIRQRDENRSESAILKARPNIKLISHPPSPDTPDRAKCFFVYYENNPIQGLFTIFLTFRKTYALVKKRLNPFEGWHRLKK